MSAEKNNVHDFISDTGKTALSGGSTAEERNEVTIKFGKGLVGESLFRKTVKNL